MTDKLIDYIDPHVIVERISRLPRATWSAVKAQYGSVRTLDLAFDRNASKLRWVDGGTLIAIPDHRRSQAFLALMNGFHNVADYIAAAQAAAAGHGQPLMFSPALNHNAMGGSAAGLLPQGKTAGKFGGYSLPTPGKVVSAFDVDDLSGLVGAGVGGIAGVEISNLGDGEGGPMDANWGRYLGFNAWPFLAQGVLVAALEAFDDWGADWVQGKEFTTTDDDTYVVNTESCIVVPCYDFDQDEGVASFEAITRAEFQMQAGESVTGYYGLGPDVAGQHTLAVSKSDTTTAVSVDLGVNREIFKIVAQGQANESSRWAVQFSIPEALQNQIQAAISRMGMISQSGTSGLGLWFKRETAGVGVQFWTEPGLLRKVYDDFMNRGSFTPEQVG